MFHWLPSSSFIFLGTYIGGFVQFEHYLCEWQDQGLKFEDFPVLQGRYRTTVYFKTAVLDGVFPNDPIPWHQRLHIVMVTPLFSWTSLQKQIG